jgi:hypothetical protein
VDPLKEAAYCEAHPTASACLPKDAGFTFEPVDASVVDAGPHVVPDAGTCGVGTVTGVICAPDMHTDVAGAIVEVKGTCDGQPFDAHATTNAQGQFSIQVPEGSWSVVATAGSFSQTYSVTVTAGQTTAIPENQLCFASNTARLAVVTGPGDHIETLLTGLGFTVTTFDGTSSGWASSAGAQQFLLDPGQMSQFDIIFFDCASGRVNGSIDFGTNTTGITQNLKSFVAGGGSVYASDWAFIFVSLVSGDIQWLSSVGNINMPFNTYDLMGYAPQMLTANVVDNGLAQYLGQTTVNINFPNNSSAHALHWGLMETVNAPAVVLISGDAEPCGINPTTCTVAGSAISDVPLAALVPSSNGSGVVEYTSFHDIDQTTTDVQQILKYLIFKL